MNDITIPKKKFQLYDEGLYPARIKEIIEETEGKFGPQLKITFALTDVDDPDATLLGWCSMNYTEKSKLFRWAKAALADQFDPDADFVASKLIGKPVMLNVETRYSENGTFNKIGDVLRAERRSTSAAKREPEPVQQTWQD